MAHRMVWSRLWLGPLGVWQEKGSCLRTERQRPSCSFHSPLVSPPQRPRPLPLVCPPYPSILLCQLHLARGLWGDKVHPGLSIVATHSCRSLPLLKCPFVKIVFSYHCPFSFFFLGQKTVLSNVQEELDRMTRKPDSMVTNSSTENEA